MQWLGSPLVEAPRQAEIVWPKCAKSIVARLGRRVLPAVAVAPRAILSEVMILT